jgi:Galactose oxidase, central domain
MAYDPLGHEAVLLEASAFSCQAYTWVFQHGSWTNLTSTLAVSPNERDGGGLVYDARDGYLLLYGGESYCGGALNDTWEFRNNTWYQLHPKIAPPSLADFGMAFDSKTREVVLFGGYSTTGGNVTSSVSRSTWTYYAGNWTRLNTSSSPNGFYFVSMTYDDRMGEIVLFGGEQERGGVFSYSNTTWTFDGKQWRELRTSSAPSRRASIGLAYDVALGEVVLFGGNLYNDTWTFSGPSGWTDLTPHLARSPPPSTISAVAMVYDPSVGGILLFTGPPYGSAVHPGETWVLS